MSGKIVEQQVYQTIEEILIMYQAATGENLGELERKIVSSRIVTLGHCLAKKHMVTAIMSQSQLLNSRINVRSLIAMENSESSVFTGFLYLCAAEQIIINDGEEWLADHISEYKGEYSLI